LTQLCTGHTPLNDHLYKIGSAPLPRCPRCDAPWESVIHFLLVCPAYRHHCHHLVCKLGHQATLLCGLLSSLRSLKPLFTYIQDTGRFAQTKCPSHPTRR
ncbi:hypothetical protein OBBRIDRAFT_732037, partial [Obba rivulosa]